MVEVVAYIKVVTRFVLMKYLSQGVCSSTSGHLSLSYISHIFLFVTWFPRVCTWVYYLQYSVCMCDGDEVKSYTVWHPLFLLSAWKTIADPDMAADRYRQDLLQAREDDPTLRFKFDITEDIEDQEARILSFYKAPKTDWNRPFQVKLQGNVNIGV